MENAVVDNSLAFHLMISDLQVDDQLTFSEHPVLFSKVTMKGAEQPAWKFQVRMRWRLDLNIRTGLLGGELAP